MRFRLRLLALMAAVLVIRHAPAQRPEPHEETSPPPRQVPAPAAKWSFDGAEPGTWAGTPKFETTALRAPQFPRLSTNNKAAFFPGKGFFLRVREKELSDPLRFDQGDALTLVAWVNPTALGDKAYAYVVGKGR